METRAKDVIAGTLRPNDPRRFLVEAMIGAMNADGAVDQRERDVLARYLAEHEMFAGVSATNAKLLIEIQARYDTLTSREREVISRVVSGMRNKGTALALGISEVTVKVHRHNIMEKMGARSLPSLASMVERLQKPV